jgi:hypothetical protein
VPIYAAYGSNMDPEQMLERAPHSPMSGTGWLLGWRLTVLYDMSPEDERSLDRWEGSELGIHRKLKLRVQTLDGSVLAWLYVLDSYEGGLPSARYLGVMADAAYAAGAPEDYVYDLRVRSARNVGPGTHEA